MKKLWLAVFLIVGLLLLSIFASKLIRDTALQVTEKLELALRAGEMGDSAAAARYTQEAAAIWDAKIPILDALTHHSGGDNISGALTELAHYAELRHPEEFLAHCARLIHDLKQIHDLALPLPQNIL